MVPSDHQQIGLVAGSAGLTLVGLLLVFIPFFGSALRRASEKTGVKQAQIDRLKKLLLLTPAPIILATGCSTTGFVTAFGIIDPAKVTRAAIENAASVAGMVLTTESAVTDVPEKRPPMMPPGGGDHMDF